MDEVANELLSKIPQGEELLDSRDGTHESAILKEVNLLEDRSGLVLVFTGMRDNEGNDFDYQHRVTFPTHNGENWIQFRFLDTLRGMGFIGPKEKPTHRYIETPEAVEATVELFRTQIGTSYKIRLRTGNSGFMNLSFLRK